MTSTLAFSAADRTIFESPSAWFFGSKEIENDREHIRKKDCFSCPRSSCRNRCTGTGSNQRKHFFRLFVLGRRRLPLERARAPGRLPFCRPKWLGRISRRQVPAMDRDRRRSERALRFPRPAGLRLCPAALPPLFLQ